jgi:hypothetical protein
MNTDAPKVQLIVKFAHEELRQLIQQRAAITKRIGTIKQTILGLRSLFGDDELSDGDVRESADCAPTTRRRGLTQACRAMLRKFDRPLTARELSEHIRQQDLLGVRSSKNLAVSVAVVLNRLVQYGEARVVLRDNGRRAWMRVSDVEDENASPLNSADSLVSYSD